MTFNNYYMELVNSYKRSKPGSINKTVIIKEHLKFKPNKKELFYSEMSLNYLLNKREME